MTKWRQRTLCDSLLEKVGARAPLLRRGGSIYKGGCPIHLKGAPEVEHQRRRGRWGLCPSQENFCISYYKMVSFYAFPVIFIDTVLFIKGHPNQKGGCPDTLQPPGSAPASWFRDIRTVTVNGKALSDVDLIVDRTLTDTESVNIALSVCLSVCVTAYYRVTQ